MIIGHIPAGYITARLLLSRAHAQGVAVGRLMLASLAGAIAPDVDLLYFYLVDHRQHHHHSYFTHFPVLWATAMLVCVAWWYTGRARQWAVLAGIFSFAGLVHMMLDSVVGDIAWLAPFEMERYSLFYVPAVYKIWWFNFILHWSFLLELALVTSAVIMWYRGPAGRAPGERNSGGVDAGAGNGTGRMGQSVRRMRARRVRMMKA